MARKKVKLAFIVNNSSRKATYRKRKKGLLKKVNEISTLCGIAAGAIIYSPYDPNPEVWPSAADMLNLINEFRNVPQTERDKNMLDQKKFLQQRIDKAKTNMTKQMKENREAHLTEVMYQCLFEKMGPSDIPSWALNDLAYLLEQFLDIVNRRIKILGGSDMEVGEPSNAVPATDPSEPVRTLTIVEGATAPATTVHGVVSSSSSAAAGASLFNQLYHFPQHHQQFHPPSAASYRGLNDQLRNQNRFMEMMNRTQQMVNAANQMRFPSMDYTHRYHQAHPHHHHQPPQQQQLFPCESSTAPPPATSGSDTPATTPNPTNNLWFR